MGFEKPAGLEGPDFSRATKLQKCVRASAPGGGLDLLCVLGRAARLLLCQGGELNKVDEAPKEKHHGEIRLGQGEKE